MFKIIKFSKKYWYIMVIIVVMQGIRVFCDLSLPQYTTNIVDVGIQNGGIDSIVPEVIRQSEFEEFLNNLPKEESKMEIEESYYLIGIDHMVEKQYQELLQKYPTLKEENLYILKADANKIALEAIILEGVSPTEEQVITKKYMAYIKEEYQAIGIDLEKMQLRYMLKNGGVMLAFAFAGMGISVIAAYFTSKLAARTSMDLRKKVFEKVITFSNGEMDQFSTASLITRSTNDIQQIQMVTLMLFRPVVLAPIMVIGGVMKVLQTNNGSMLWIIGLAVLAVSSIVAILMGVTMPKFKIMQKLIDKLNLVTREILIGIPVVRAFSREKYEEERFDKANRDLMKTQVFTNKIMSMMQPFMILIMNIVGIVIIWVGAKAIDMGTLQVGEMMAFITYAMQIIFAFLMITMVSIMIPRAAVAAGRVEEVLQSETLIADDKILQELPAEGRGTIKFNHVHFKYPGADEDALSDIDFTAKSGETTAIIGSTGCGKSTLLHLIPRLYDVTKGSITMDGVDIRKLSQEQLRNTIGFVPQKGVLFSGTITKNISFGKQDATVLEIEEAIKIAQGADFVAEKPEGLETYIAQGGDNISGGQKQRLAIARALIKNPKLYIFDDSFSALDYKTDVALRKALKETTKDSTVIIVAQRISTIIEADKIIVLEDGHIIGTGTHQELLENNEIYRQIAISQ